MTHSCFDDSRDVSAFKNQGTFTLASSLEKAIRFVEPTYMNMKRDFSSDVKIWIFVVLVQVQVRLGYAIL